MQTQTNMQALENCIEPTKDSDTRRIKAQSASDIEIDPTKVNLTQLPLHNNQSTFVVTVNGNAMDAAGIAHGDSVLIDASAHPSPMISSSFKSATKRFFDVSHTTSRSNVPA